jgi:hypothetical protein
MVEKVEGEPFAVSELAPAPTVTGIEVPGRITNAASEAAPPPDNSDAKLFLKPPAPPFLPPPPAITAKLTVIGAAAPPPARTPKGISIRQSLQLAMLL